MKRKSFISLVLSIVILISLCACASQEKPLYQLYQSEKINTVVTDLPDCVDISIINGGTPSYAYNIADTSFIETLANSFVKITATESAKTEDFVGKYFVDLSWGDETVHIHISDTVAEIIGENTVNYYCIENAESFLSLINGEVAANEEAMQGYDNIVSEQNVEINVSKDISFNENGNCLMNVFILNRNDRAISVTPVNVTVNGKKIADCTPLSVSGNSELGFQVVFDTQDVKELKSLSMNFEVCFANASDCTAFIVSPEYKVDM